jgi:hypothetical protein
MIFLKKKKQTIYSIIGIIIIILLAEVIEIKYYSIVHNGLWLVLIGIINTFLFIFGLEEISFKGRCESKISFLWLIYFIFSTLSAFLFFALFGFVLNELKVWWTELVIGELATFFIVSIWCYFIFKFFQLLYLRLQDLNQPGNNLVGFFPIISWFIGVKIYKSGYRFLGVLVFLNLAVGILYVLFVNGSKGANYFGTNPIQIARFRKELKRIKKAESLNNDEKANLTEELILKYKEIEENEIEKFTGNEVARLLAREKIEIDGKSDITQNRKNFFENQVNEKISKYYSKFNWCTS